MVGDWIDDLVAVWAIQANSFQTVRSVWLMKDTAFPESIDLNELSQHPVALTFWPDLEPQYSAGGPLIAYWSGETEFHLCPDFKKSRIPELLAWYKLIWNAAAGHATLNGKVELFLIPPEADAISLTSLQYGQEEKHWGMVVKWIVKEDVTGEITVSA